MDRPEGFAADLPYVRQAPVAGEEFYPLTEPGSFALLFARLQADCS